MKKKHTIEIGAKTTLVIEVEENATTEEILDDNHDVINELVTEMVNGYEISIAIGEGTDDVLDDAAREGMRERADAWMDETADGAMDHVADIIEETCREAVEAKVRAWGHAHRGESEGERLAQCAMLAGEAERLLEAMRVEFDIEETREPAAGDESMSAQMERVRARLAGIRRASREAK